MKTRPTLNDLLEGEKAVYESRCRSIHAYCEFISKYSKGDMYGNMEVIEYEGVKCAITMDYPGVAIVLKSLSLPAFDNLMGEKEIRF